ncbi:hypothetical protein ACFQ1S_02365 [Kibdelosporangium lantanae]|uniref:Uncharacterized protein n=1 Tax=Kibdelosporangium lantanae TaxID=1497396 RepID=A0ABW3M564_9PSEU
MEELLQMFFAECDAAVERCALSGPLGAGPNYFALVAAARDGRLLEASGEAVTADQLLATTVDALQDPQLWMPFSAQLASMHAAHASSCPAGPAPATTSPVSGSDLTYTAVTCADAAKPTTTDAWSTATRDAQQSSQLFGPYWLSQSLPCATWPAPESSQLNSTPSPERRSTAC